jgi:cyclopropane fatty-acyl-phospholipid synthase-like methyltransferase
MEMDTSIKQILVESYNANARLRDKAEIEEWKRQELDYFLAHVGGKKGSKVLDIGAGSGQHSKFLQDHGCHMLCIDMSYEMIQSCEAKGLEARVMDFYALDLADESFDGVWSMNALLHVPKKSLDFVLSNIRRVMKTGGLFYMGVYGGIDSEGVWEEDSYEPKRFFSFYSDKAIQDKVRPFFELLDFRTVRHNDRGMDYQAMLLRMK